MNNIHEPGTTKMSQEMLSLDELEVQKARSKLRERFLLSLTSLQGKTCNITTYEYTKLHGTFMGYDRDFSEILFDNLKTPTGVALPHSIVRVSDIVSIEFEETADNT